MQENINFEIKKLDWDTDFFGIKSAKVILKRDINDIDINSIINYLKENKFKFVTIQNTNNNDNNNYILKEVNRLFLTDVNIQFEKVLDLNIRKECNDKDVIINSNISYNQDIEKIASESFIYSRFINDKNLNNGKSVYSEWVKNAFEKEDKFFVLNIQNNKVMGFLLFSIQNEQITIELIAVDSCSKHKGIGKKLINNLEAFAQKNNIKKINVGTQLNNLNAQNFYINCGFKHIINHSIYHLWL